MKKLFCVVVTDEIGTFNLDSPIVFHVRCETSTQAGEEVKTLLIDEYEYDEEFIEDLDLFAFEVNDTEIIEIN